MKTAKEQAIEQWLEAQIKRLGRVYPSRYWEFCMKTAGGKHDTRHDRAKKLHDHGIAYLQSQHQG